SDLAASRRTPPGASCPGTSCTIMLRSRTPRDGRSRTYTTGGAPVPSAGGGLSGSLVRALVVPERLDRAAVAEGHGVAVPVQRAAGGHPDPALGHAVFLHVLA